MQNLCFRVGLLRPGDSYPCSCHYHLLYPRSQCQTSHTLHSLRLPLFSPTTKQVRPYTSNNIEISVLTVAGACYRVREIEVSLYGSLTFHSRRCRTCPKHSPRSIPIYHNHSVLQSLNQKKFQRSKKSWIEYLVCTFVTSILKMARQLLALPVK